MTIKIRKLVK